MSDLRGDFASIRSEKSLQEEESEKTEDDELILDPSEAALQ